MDGWMQVEETNGEEENKEEKKGGHKGHRM